MKKRNICVLVLILLFSFILTGCPNKDKEPELTEEEKRDLQTIENFNKADLITFFGDSDPENVYGYFMVTSLWEEHEIYWESNNPESLKVQDMFVWPTLGEEDVEVILKATIILRDDLFAEREFRLIVKKQRPQIIHTIELDLNGGDYPLRTVIYAQETSKLDIRESPKKAGHEFIGWTLDGEPFDIKNTRIYSSFTLVAQYERLNIPEKVVCLDVDGAFNFQSKTSYLVEPNGLFTLPEEEPYKIGYYFVGWTLNGSPFDPTTPITQDITLVASYLEEIQVIVQLAGGTLEGMEEETYYFIVKGGTIEPIIGTPTKYGYTFTGWLNYHTGKVVDFSEPINKNLTVIRAYYEFNPEQIALEEIKPKLLNDYNNKEYSHGNTINLLKSYGALDDKYFTVSWTTDPVDLLDSTGKVVSSHTGLATLHATIKYQSYNFELEIPITIKGNVVDPTEYGAYYDDITATSGEALVNQLQTLVTGSLGANGEGNVTYGTVREILPISDLKIGETNKVWGIYDSSVMNSRWGTGWDREHVWPQSRLNSSSNNSRSNIASDVHNLRACLSSTNNTRGNNYFVDGSGTNKTIGEGYYPGDEHRGDVARILLFMAVRYKGILTLVDTQRGANNTAEGTNLATLSVLLSWHQADAPDEFERQRNNVIHEWQGNRNPFIDKPEYFEPVWEVLMQNENLSVSKTTAFNNTINAYETLKTNYISLETKYFI